MKGVSQAVFALCLMPAFLTGAAWAQTGTPSRTTRQYSGRIQMHTTPITLQVPDSSLDMEKRPNFRNTDLELLIPETPPPDEAGPPEPTPVDAAPKIVDPAQKLLIHDDGITVFFCGPGIPSLDFMIQRFRSSEP